MGHSVLYRNRRARTGPELRYEYARLRYSRFFQLLVFVLPFILCFTFSAVSKDEAVPRGGDSLVEGPSALRDVWGIDIVSLRLTAAGHILDLRYRVIDPVKAFPVLDLKVKPVLIDEESGRDLSVYTAPRIGGLRQKTRRPEAGRVYFVLFSNPNSLLKEGSTVTLKINDVRVHRIPVGQAKPHREESGGT